MAYNHNFELIETKKLIPYINNAKIHGENQIKQIASSITEFGFTNPILVDTMNNVIAGHGRLKAAEKLGIEEVPCIVITGLTEAQKKALIIADNKIAENSDWDIELLSNELESLKELDFDFSDLGFDFAIFDSLEDDTDDSLFSDVVVEDKDNPVKLSIVFDSESDKRKLKEELLSRGFLCQ
jgi:ParB-like chromosome segregation protein Spo0J